MIPRTWRNTWDTPWSTRCPETTASSGTPASIYGLWRVQRELESDWESREALGFAGGALDGFIVSGGVVCVISSPATVGIQQWRRCSNWARISSFTHASRLKGIDTLTWRSMMTRWSRKAAHRGGLVGGALSSMQGRRGRRWHLSPCPIPEAVSGWWAGHWAELDGLRPGNFLSPIFSVKFSFLIFCFSFLIWIQTYL
jgi:hypothetical protein